MVKQIAVVKKILHANQFIGLPIEMSDASASKSMPSADFLVIEGNEASYMLWRYTIDGGFAGDTWHASLDDAVYQANYEFGLIGGDWVVVPSDVDSIMFAQKHSGKSSLE